MGVADVPYLYDPPVRRPVAYPYSNFNPRAATQAAHEAEIERQKPKPKQDGPLVNFNKHPDSYMIIPYTRSNVAAMPANTKKKVTVVRWVQFALRIVQLIGALGVLVCVICIRGTQDAQGWIIRIPPAWDSLITLYAIYHLIRPAKVRTPASSASYHLFALFMDAGLVPFYVFIVLMSRSNWIEAPGTTGRWRSFFTSDVITGDLLLATWIGAIAVGTLHLTCLGFDLWLIVLFRKIARLPPDMNPLEDNLTSRRASKHKHKTSELSTSTVSMTDEERMLAHLSGSTLSASNKARLSTAKIPDMSTVPFQHSRTGSKTSFSPHNPESARLSRQQFDEGSMYGQSTSARSSRGDVNRHSRPGSTSPSKRDFYAESLAVPSAERLPSPRPASYVSAHAKVPSRHSTPAPTKEEVEHQQKQGLLNDNWQVYSDSTSDLGTQDRRSPVTQFSRRPQYDYHEPGSNRAMIPPRPLKTQLHDRHDSFEPEQCRPLGMNPPTPPSPQLAFDDRMEEPKRYQLSDSARAAGVHRSTTSASNVTAGSSVYSESAPSLKSSKGSNSPKRRYYGDLAAATRGVRGSPQQQQQPPLPSNSLVPQPQYSPQKQTRVISRTGVDIADAGVFQVEDSFGGRSRREVSGKIVEEGRGGTGWAMRKREVSGVS